MKIAFLVNFCTHYRKRTYEILAERIETDFYFFSGGREWYWLPEHGNRSGSFRTTELAGFTLAGTRITPALPWHLARGGYDCVVKCINGRFALPVTYLSARALGIPFVLWTGIWHRIETRAHRLLWPLTRSVYRGADAVVTYGTHVRDYLVSEGVEARRIFSSRHAVDNQLHGRLVPENERQALRQRFDLDPERPVVLFLGRLLREKGVGVLLAAFAALEHPRAQLLLVGTGADEDWLRAEVERRGLESRTRFGGYLEPDQTPAAFALATVCCMPSQTTPTWKEPWGLVANEAMNQGVPVIASDCVGAAAGGLIQDGINGLVVPEGRPEPLRRALDRILGDPEERRRFSEAARDRVALWSNEHMVDSFLEAVAQVTDPSHDPRRSP